jgi:hypothetical protein
LITTPAAATRRGGGEGEGEGGGGAGAGGAPAVPAIIDAVNDDGETALFYAARRSHPACVALLLARGARRDVLSRYGDLAEEESTDVAVLAAFRGEWVDEAAAKAVAKAAAVAGGQEEAEGGVAALEAELMAEEGDIASLVAEVATLATLAPGGAGGGAGVAEEQRRPSGSALAALRARRPSSSSSTDAPHRST